jgi:hypothetical protein
MSRFFLLANLLLVVFSSFGQAVQYSFEFKNVPFERVLNEISSATGYEFVYVREVLPKKFVTQSWRDVSVEDVISDLLSDEIVAFNIIGSTITLYASRSLTDPFQIYGQLTDAASGEFLTGANIFTNSFQGVVSDNYGLYSIEVNPIRDSIVIFSYLGYQAIVKMVSQLKEERLDLLLKPDFNLLQEVTITQDKKASRITSPFQNTLNAETYQTSRSISGDQDIIEYVNAIPGIVKMSEGKTGFSVHGSATDQNLILIDEAPVFNPGHALGFLSVFNHEALNSVTFHKTAISSRYGGRLSSVLDIRMREGNSNNISSTLSSNPFYSGLTLEGPLVKEKASFLISGRKSHLNFILDRFDPKPEFYIPQSINFYDLHGKINFQLGKNNRIYVSSFINNDDIRPHKPNAANFFYDTQWQNRTFTLRWNSIWGDKLFTNASFVFSDYEYVKSSTTDTARIKYREQSQIANAHIKLESSYHLSKNQHITAGINATSYQFNPASGSISVPSDTFQLVYRIDQIRSRELAIFVEDEIKIGQRAHVFLGLRYSQFFDIGNGTYEFQYDDSGMVFDSVFRQKNKVIRTFKNLEPRISLDLILHDNLTLTSSYSRTSQYLIRLLNENPTTPNEYWIPAGPQIKPLTSKILAASLSWQLSDYSVLMFGGFSRNSKNVSSFKNGANIFFSESLIDRQITQGNFKSRGIECTISKRKAAYRYLLSYTFTDAKVRFPVINEGKYFDAAQNYRHDLNLQGTLYINNKLNFGANFQWRSGDRITLPSGFGYFAGYPFEIYNERNNLQLPNYARLDISSNYKIISSEHISLDLSLGVYNISGQLNPFQVSVVPDEFQPRIDILALYNTTPFLHIKLKYQ